MTKKIRCSYNHPVCLFAGSEVGVIEGVEMAIVKMKKGEVANVDIRPRYAYGEAGNEERNVPPNATLKYTLTLKDFVKVRQRDSNFANISQKNLKIC